MKLYLLFKVDRELAEGAKAVRKFCKEYKGEG